MMIWMRGEGYKKEYSRYPLAFSYGKGDLAFLLGHRQEVFPWRVT
jgi:hypothetical protein